MYPPSLFWSLLTGVALCLVGMASKAEPPVEQEPEQGFEQALAAASYRLLEDDGTARLIAAANQARILLLGEASHGTHEFYVWRDRLSRELIETGEISFIAVEGDTATLAPLDRYVRLHANAPRSAVEALADITHWPTWVWANAEFAQFAEWLRGFNSKRSDAARIAIYGLDIYAIWEALDELVAFYQKQAPDHLVEVEALRERLEPYRERPRDYTHEVRYTGRSLRPDLQAMLRGLERRYVQASAGQRDAAFSALQHARAIAAGLHYLEALPGPPRRAAGVRSRHFGSALQHLLRHHGDLSRAIVWAHNTHIGDARGTDARFTGEASLGQLAREQFGQSSVFIVGFGSGTGEVIAATRWGGQCRVMPVPVPRADSLEAALLATGDGDRLLLFGAGRPATPLLSRWLAHRAIGVVYDIEREAVVHYVPTRFAERYDAFVFLPHTKPLAVLDWPSGDPRCRPERALATGDPIAPGPAAR